MASDNKEASEKYWDDFEIIENLIEKKEFSMIQELISNDIYIWMIAINK